LLCVRCPTMLIAAKIAATIAIDTATRWLNGSWALCSACSACSRCSWVLAIGTPSAISSEGVSAIRAVVGPILVGSEYQGQEKPTEILRGKCCRGGSLRRNPSRCKCRKNLEKTGKVVAIVAERRVASHMETDHSDSNRQHGRIHSPSRRAPGVGVIGFC